MFQTVEFSCYDTNGDGKLDHAEFVEKPNRAFVLLDKDHTCRLVAGARAHTEQIFDSKKASSGDPRENCPKGMKC
jgi:EF hand